ncbi:hypothetical protein ODJ79_41450 [Actinoplanes sp. KI2]|uniref:hypothetical protein n=1 Tax=Actinoplanes sp. KI2 TaxID=2983315 RepID=UPI0021D586A0|nr:hypothetical protein [Actinoplanes sp. KI2]MCU7730222.1 hypothetical protein [Actinoplanes sp. KI2]
MWFQVSPEIDAVLDSTAADLAYVVYAIAGVVAVLALRRRRVRPVVLLAAAPLVAYGLARGLAHLDQHRTVPPATAAFAIAYAILLFFDRRVGLALAAGAVVVGLDHPSDMAVAAAIASLAVFVVHLGGSLVVVKENRDRVRLPGPGAAG